jgi:murein DD-endopeptidase MepM/ murein hydrolase activator NlpD
MRRLSRVLPALLLLAGMSSAAPADAFRVQAEPRTIAPGDPFLIRVKGLTTMHQPRASVFGKGLRFVSCGKGCAVAVGAADIAVKPGRYRIVVAAGENRRTAAITVRAQEFPVLHVTLPEDKVSLGEADAERVLKEENLLRALWQEQTEKRWEGRFVLPLGNEISTQFGVKRIINAEKESVHRGIDIRGTEGEEVRASNRGTVVLAEELFFGGNTLVLDHGMGIYTVYMHLDRFHRGRGEEVVKGDVIGFVGSTGRSTGPHLHFGMKVQEVSVNPAAFMKLKL